MTKNDVSVYLSDTISLARSMVIKSLDTAYLINKYLKSIYGEDSVDDSDPKTWRYYKNLSGEYYSITYKGQQIAIDKPMTVKSLDTGAVISFDKQTLKNHPTTALVYRGGGRRFRVLLNRYPDQELLIKGILYPVDINEAIAAKDHTILNYNTFLVENNEFSLIEDVQSWIHRFVARWYNRAYTIVDEYYLPAFLSTLYLNLVPKILNLRLAKCLTDEAHSFHIDTYLRSHRCDGINIRNLDTNVRLWLYKNIRHLERSSGTDDTTKTMIQKLFLDRGYSVNKYLLMKDSTDTEYKQTLGVPGYSFIKEPVILNEFSDISRSTDNLDDLIGKQKEIEGILGYRGNQEVDLGYAEIKERLALADASVKNTKLIEIVKNTIRELTPTSTLELVIDNWVNLVHGGQYNAGVLFVDPESGIEYSINQKQALLMFALYIASRAGISDPVLPTWYVRLGYRSNLSLQKLNQLTNRDDNFNFPIVSIISSVTNPATINNISEFKTFIVELIGAYRDLWLEAYLKNDYFETGEYRKSISALFQVSEYPPRNPNTLLKDELEANNIIVAFNPNYNYANSIIELVKVCTGYTIDPAVLENAITDPSIDLFGRFTSYTTQKLFGRTVDSLQYDYSTYNQMIRPTKQPVRHVYKPQIILDWSNDQLDYLAIDNTCNTTLVSQGSCENKNYINGQTTIPTSGASTLSPMLDLVTADSRRVGLVVRTSEYETIIK